MSPLRSTFISARVGAIVETSEGDRTGGTWQYDILFLADHTSICRIDRVPSAITGLGVRPRLRDQEVSRARGNTLLVRVVT